MVEVEGVIEIADGVGLITTVKVAAVEEHPSLVAVKEYVPAAAIVTEGMLGFCWDEVNPLGPVQLKEFPISVVPVRLSVPPAQGVLADAEAVGKGFTVTVTEALNVIVQLSVTARS
jgi:hypothetical protein